MASVDERPRERTAFNCLEEDHYEVARSALKLAEAAEWVLQIEGWGLQETNINFRRLRNALTSFREAASRTV